MHSFTTRPPEAPSQYKGVDLSCRTPDPSIAELVATQPEVSSSAWDRLAILMRG
jgi:hypothetical protein